jgi:AcrR family transcriptional regulator
VERRADAERRLVDATLEVIAEKGLTRATMTEIGQRAGFSRGLPAHHFGNKAGLLAAVSRTVRIRFIEMFETTDAPNGLDAILALVSAYLDAKDTPAARAWGVIISELIFFDEPLQRPIVEWNAAVVAQVSERMRRGIVDGSIRADVDPRRQAVILIGMLRGISLQGRVDSSAVLDKALHAELLETVRRALTASGATPSAGSPPQSK